MQTLAGDSEFPLLMGVVNVTPDSFSDGGLYHDASAAIEHALLLREQGADILDIGGESSRPGSDGVSLKEELRRVIPVIEGIRAQDKQVPISIDTTKPEVARAALECGAGMLNDISGLRREPLLADVAAEHNAALVLMHSIGMPKTMQQNPHYGDVLAEVYQFLERQIAFARSCGVGEIYADVGIGFGKTLRHNLELLRRHQEFQGLGVPMLLGISRKSFIGLLTGIGEAADRDPATLSLHLMLLSAGAAIIRVHNVALHQQARKLHQALYGT